MKIAVPTQGGQVAGHFGHCPQFTIAEVEEGKIKEKTVIDNPGHQPGFLPKFLAEKGVKCIIAGGMGASAIDLFTSYGVEVITGAQGPVEKMVQAYLEGNLVSSGEVCCEHQHAGSCGGH